MWNLIRRYLIWIADHPPYLWDRCIYIIVDGNYMQALGSPNSDKITRLFYEDLDQCLEDILIRVTEIYDNLA